MFTYALSIFLASTALVSTNAEYGIPLLRYTVFVRTVLQSDVLKEGRSFFTPEDMLLLR